MRTDILEQAQSIRASMDAAAIVLTDEQAAKAPRLYPAWKASKSYTVGERIRYNGILYKVLQAPHKPRRLDSGCCSIAFCKSAHLRSEHHSRMGAARKHKSL